MFLNTPIGKIVTEALRWGLLALLATVISKLLVLVPTIEQTPSIEALLMVLRFADAVLHKTGLAEKGITRF